MVAAVKQVVTVQPGGVVEVRSADLRPGARAEVTVRLLAEDEQPPAAPPAPRTWASFIGSGKGAFKSAEDIDAYIREIRDWGDRDRDPE